MQLPFALIEDADKGFVGIVLTEDVGRRRLRFLFQYEGELRAMAWMMVGSDGSLYLNPRMTSSEKVIRGSAVADGAGGFTGVELEEVDIATFADRDVKLSHHASGVVNRADGRSRGISPRDVTEPTMFRQDDYAHPSRFTVIEEESLRPTDIVVPTLHGAPFELTDSRPLTSRIWVAPLQDGAANVAVVDDLPLDRQTAIVTPFLGLRECQDLTHQIQFFEAPGKDNWRDISMTAVLDAPPSEAS